MWRPSRTRCGGRNSTPRKPGGGRLRRLPRKARAAPGEVATPEGRVKDFMARAYRSSAAGVATLPPDLVQARKERAELGEAEADASAVHEMFAGEAAKAEHERKVQAALRCADAVARPKPRR